jgi:hypothetical protein
VRLALISALFVLAGYSKPAPYAISPDDAQRFAAGTVRVVYRKTSSTTAARRARNCNAFHSAQAAEGSSRSRKTDRFDFFVRRGVYFG